MKADFSDADPLKVRRAANRGNLVEAYCYRLLQGLPVTVRSRHTGSLRDSVTERVECFARWMAEYKPELVDFQNTVWSDTDRIAWTRDFRAVINGQLFLVDIKCAVPQKDWPLYLGCGLSYDEDGANHAAILQLNPAMNKKGYKFRDNWKGPQLKSWWSRAVDRWRSDRDFNKLKNELGFDSEAMGFETEEND